MMTSQCGIRGAAAVAAVMFLAGCGSPRIQARPCANLDRDVRVRISSSSRSLRLPGQELQLTSDCFLRPWATRTQLRESIILMVEALTSCAPHLCAPAVEATP